MTKLFASFWYFVLLQVLDAVTTILGLQRGAVEGNPIAAWIMTKIGMYNMLLLGKGTFVAFMSWFCYTFPRSKEGTLAVINGIFTTIVLSNLWTLYVVT